MANKKAVQMSLQMIVGIVLLILGFGAILLFYNALNPKGIIDKEACHASVILKKATPSILKENTKFEVPLNCKTEKICFVTSTSEKCEEFTDDEYEKKEVENIPVKNKDDIMEKIADSLVEWWQTMGEGKGAMIWERDRFVLGKTVHGVINVRFASSPDVIQNYNTFGEEDLARYMSDKKPEDSDKNYWQLLSTQEKNNLNFEYTGTAREKIDLNNQYAIVFFEQQRGKLAATISQGGALLLGTIAGAQLASKVPGGITIKTLTSDVVVYSITSTVSNLQQAIEDWWLGTDETYFNAISFIEYNKKNIQDLNIGEFDGLP